MLYLQEYDPIKAGSIDGINNEFHDAAVKRATMASYRPPKGLKTDPLCTLFVGRLNYDTTESSIEKHFKRYGHIENISLIRNQVTGLSQGYAFVSFQSERATGEAYHKANKSILDDHVILVDYERSRNMKNWIPRRLGGGFGGKKESGQLRFGGRDRPFRPRDTPPIPYELRKSDSWIHSGNHGSRSRESNSRHYISDRHSRRSKSRDKSRYQRSSSRDNHYSKSRRHEPSADKHNSRNNDDRKRSRY